MNGGLGPKAQARGSAADGLCDRLSVGALVA